MKTKKPTLMIFAFTMIVAIMVSCNESNPTTNSNIQKQTNDTLLPVIIQIDTNASFHPVCVNNKIGYINNEGTMVIQPQFELACDFYDNRAMIKENDKYGYIDKTGKTIINAVLTMTMTLVMAWH